MTRLGYWSRLEYELYEVNMSGLVYNSTKAEYTEESILKMYEMNSTVRGLSIRFRSWLIGGVYWYLFRVWLQRRSWLGSSECCGCLWDMPKDERDYVIKKFKEGKIRVVLILVY